MIGARLRPYRIVAALGAGGMGEVHRAKDERLGRDVAIKILPKAVAEDSERLARFEREAKALAALSHPKYPRTGTTSIPLGPLEWIHRITAHMPNPGQHTRR